MNRRKRLGTRLLFLLLLSAMALGISGCFHNLKPIYPEDTGIKYLKFVAATGNKEHDAASHHRGGIVLATEGQTDTHTEHEDRSTELRAGYRVEEITQARLHVGIAAFECMDNDHEKDGKHFRHIDPYLTTGVDFAVGKKKMFHMLFCKYAR